MDSPGEVRRRASGTPGSPGGKAMEDGCAGDTGGTCGTPTPAAHGAAAKQQLSCVGLVVLIFYNVCGGPFGSEEAVRAAGPLYALSGFVVFPVLWSLPQAFLTAELATAFPDDSGYVGWVTAAFGPFWGFIQGVLALICGAVDNAVYPALFVAYLKFGLCDLQLHEDLESSYCPVLEDRVGGMLPSLHTLIVLISSGLLSYLNWRGLELVGRVATCLTVFMLLPFGLLVLVGLPHVDPARWLNTKPLGHHPGLKGWTGRGRGRRTMGYDWMTYLNVLFWNLNYWDSASTLAGEVDNPKKSFPRALRWAVLLVTLTYMLPMAVSIAALPPGQSWDTGFFVRAGQLLGGTWLQAWILASAAVSCIGQFLAVQAGNTYLLLGMAELGLLPSVFATRSPHGAPTVGIVLSLATVLLLSTRSVVDLVAMLNGVYCLAQLLEFAAFLELRRRCPTLQRPYRLPTGLAGCAAMLVCPALMCLTLLGIPYLEGSWGTAAFTAASVPMAVLLYLASEGWRRRRPGSFLRPAQQRLGAGATSPGSGELAPAAAGGEGAAEAKPNQAAEPRQPAEPRRPPPDPQVKKIRERELRRARRMQKRNPDGGAARLNELADLAALSCGDTSDEESGEDGEQEASGDASPPSRAAPEPAPPAPSTLGRPAEALGEQPGASS